MSCHAHMSMQETCRVMHMTAQRVHQSTCTPGPLHSTTHITHPAFLQTNARAIPHRCMHLLTNPQPQQTSCVLVGRCHVFIISAGSIILIRHAVLGMPTLLVTQIRVPTLVAVMDQAIVHHASTCITDHYIMCHNMHRSHATTTQAWRQCWVTSKAPRSKPAH